MTTAPTAATPAAEPARPGAMRRLLRQPVSLMCLAFLLLLVAVAVLAPWLAPFDPSASNPSARLQGPSATNWFGTDDLGRDVLSRAMFGARVALLASLQAVLLALVAGVPLGLYAAYKGGLRDWVTMRIGDVEQAIPMLLLAFTFIAILGRGLSVAMLAVSVGFTFGYIRLIRSVVLAEREKLYVDAGRVQGYRTPRLLFKHILPNAIGPVIVQTSILFGMAILIEAMLSFLGLGVESGTASWGGMLEEARRFQISQPTLSLVPGLLITLTVLCFNLLGDGLRDALRPQQRSARRRTPVAVTAAATARDSSQAAVSQAPAESSPAGHGALLSVRDLSITFPGHGGDQLPILSGVSFDVRPGEIFGLVGESGSGKSMTAQAITGMIPEPGTIPRGSITLSGRELTTLSSAQWQSLRGNDVSLLFQDPMAALSPVHTVGMQITESIRAHEKVPRAVAYERAIELLERVKVPHARERMGHYPHQFSGGMAQRALIAAALVCRPRLLIADEPTTALDVTVQAEVLSLLRELRDEFGMSVIFITHDLGVVAELCDRVGVMYAGQIVEVGEVAEVIRRPRHPYTSALIGAMPDPEVRDARMRTIGGTVPPPWDLPPGCRFATRCAHAIEQCDAGIPPMVDQVRCIRAEELRSRLPGYRDAGAVPSGEEAQP